MQKVIEFESEVLEIKEITPSVKHFKISVPDEFSFKAGQFVSILPPCDGEQVIRPYSVASAPGEKSHIDLCVKYVDGICTKFLFGLKQGDKIKLKGPFGFFKMENLENDVVLSVEQLGTVK